MAEMRLLLFGDGALVSPAHVRTQLLQSRGDPYLTLFFRRSADALRHEVAQLSPLERSVIPAFTTLDELNDRISSGRCHASVQNALLCISQVTHYIE